MGTQKEIAQKIIDNEGDYILALKGNHSILHEDVIEFFKDNLDKADKNLKIAKDVDCGHGRIEERNCFVTDKIDWLGELRFPGMKSIICIDARRTIDNSTSNEKRYYISSLPANAVKINAAIRDHWAVENCLHWNLDVTFNEDNSRIRNDNAAENIAMVRHTALNLLQLSSAKYKGTSLKGLRKKAGWGNSTLQSILEQQLSWDSPVITGQLLPTFGAYDINEITAPIIREWISALGATPKTIRNCLTPLRNMFADAMNDDLIKTNPIEQIALSKLIQVASKKSEFDAEPFNEVDKQLIIDAANGQVKNLIQFGFWSGLRTSELIALKWADIDFKRGIVNRSTKKSIIIYQR
jgi:predicted transposase YbfD/YdcC